MLVPFNSDTGVMSMFNCCNVKTPTALELYEVAYELVYFTMMTIGYRFSKIKSITEPTDVEVVA